MHSRGGRSSNWSWREHIVGAESQFCYKVLHFGAIWSRIGQQLKISWIYQDWRKMWAELGLLLIPLNSHSYLYPTPRMCHSSSCLRHVFTAKHKKMSGHSMCDQLRRYFKWKWLHKEFLSVLTICLFWCVGVGFDYDLTHSKFSLILISRKISSNSLLLSKIFPAIGQMIPFQRHSWNVNWGCSRLPPTHKKVFFYKKYCIL